VEKVGQRMWRRQGMGGIGRGAEGELNLSPLKVVKESDANIDISLREKMCRPIQILT